ncbi:MAG: AAA family ATPase [Bacteroidales bacterium]|jgi:exodeoxyribonuclease-5|nr:AAA family ATPase [Bacteroidales bacterium]
MLQTFLYTKFLGKFPFAPTPDQDTLLQQFADFVCSSDEVFIIHGYAGTGKTTILKTIIETLAEDNMPSCLLAPTGRAAKVMAHYTGKPASTIHKKIYRQQKADVLSKFSIGFNSQPRTYFFVDEASMLSTEYAEQAMFGTGMLLADLFTFVFSGNNGCKLILIGDSAQLPPVGLQQSPALQADYIFQTFLKPTRAVQLTQVLRQAENSGILSNATAIRNSIEHIRGLQNFPKFRQTADVRSLSGADLLEELEHSYGTVGDEESIVITRSNKQAYRYNEGVRRSILWQESRIAVGDMLMIVKNNYFWASQVPETDFIANGDSAKVLKLGKYENLYGFSFVNARLLLIDYNVEIEAKLLLETLESEAPALTYEQSQSLYREVLADYADEGNKRKVYEQMRKHPYFNALQVKFAYAVTCHKAQGGQWKHVYIDHGFLSEDSISGDFLRWLYTAVTRATEQVFLVNFKKELLA